VRVQRPVLADLSAQTELLAVGRQDQLDRRRVEPDAVVELVHFVALVHTTDREHRLQDLDVADQMRIAREQSLHVARPIGLHAHIDPVAGDVDPRELVDDLIHLDNDDAVR
jgi:hypothetical protein